MAASKSSKAPQEKPMREVKKKRGKKRANGRGSSR